MVNRLLWILRLLNLLRLCMYSLAITTQISFVIVGAVRLWVSTNILKIFFNFKNYLLHYSPSRSPLRLNLFLVIIEIISNLARPISLSVRIIVNITCRHLILFICRILLSLTILKNFNCPVQLLFWKYPLSIIPLLMFVFIEFRVVCIQAYVFSTLSNLYLD